MYLAGFARRPRMPRVPTRARVAADPPLLPYSLPTGAGDVVHVSVSGNTFNSIRPGGVSAAAWTRIGFEVYGSGFWMPTFDQYGGYGVGFGNGGHDDGHNYYGAIWSVKSGQWTLLTPTNTGISRMFGSGTGENYTTAETGGTPYYSVSGTTPSASVPAGSHPYRNQVFYDDGTQYGRVYWVHRGGTTRSGIQSRTAHKMTISSTSAFAYAQVASCSTDRGTDDDAVVVIGTKAYRITASNNSYGSLETFDFGTETYGETSAYSTPGANCSGAGGCWAHLNRYIVKRGASDTLWIFDTQTASNGWTQLTTSGTFPAAVPDVPAPYPGGLYYWCPKAGGTSLTKLTAPADPVAGTWAFSSSSVSSSLPAHPTSGEAYVGQFSFTVGYTTYIGRPIGGDYGMHLFIPAS